MNQAAVYHRPESEYAFLYTPETMRIRLRTARNDIKKVELISGDPYLLTKEKWYLNRQPMKKITATLDHDYWQIEVSADYRRLAYGFYLTDQEGREAFYCDQGLLEDQQMDVTQDNIYFRMPYFHEIDRFKVPDWVHKTVWYQIFPERFSNGDSTNDPEDCLPWESKLPDREDFFGGDLQGIIDRLDYLEELGINGLYLCPIFSAPSNHKYDTVDYYEVDPHFGDKRVFKELVQKAHERGIKVMLDAVFNHLGKDSRQWRDVLKNGQDSKYADWFHIHSFPATYQPIPDSEFGDAITYETFSFVPTMPKLNTANREVQEYLLDVAAYWIREFDIDGWRLDVANEVDHHFWKKFHETVLEEKSELYILGEIWHSSQRWLQGDEFHAVMNYAFTESLKDFYLDQSMDAKEMIDRMNRQQMLYCDQANEVSFNLLDSHDTPRMMTLCNNDQQLLKSAFAFMFLQKGTPCLYYGTEVGLAGGPDPDCRRCMPWEKQDEALKEFFKKLIALRKRYASLLTFSEDDWVVLEERVMIFQRTYQGVTLRCTFNGSDESLRVAQTGVELLGAGVERDQQLSVGPSGFLIEQVAEN
ncbi:alpha-glycosidase [Enterococcus florum]|uniref:Alpha-amylase n=1 Tax=Enterococcus florum TaxID=2480627 RepID=A0A4P5PGZ2_9ENTE|nr:glycoside hydrolase family 13 protein [Enterococcus florum]GCF95588.1 alpha-glycosidase [Enterococcus florum]